MGKRVFKKNFFHSLVSGIGPIIFTMLVIVALLIGFRQADESSRAESIRLLEETILRVAVHSYAVNGHFPESIAYITENYNVYIDKTRFVVHYEVFAANLLPDIRVFELNQR